MPSDKEIIETLYNEIERKDKEIDRLREENKLLMKTALKAEERAKQTEEILNKKREI